MKNKINVAELLKDCPKGMELDCISWDSEAKVFLEGVLNDDSPYPIVVTVKYNNIESTKSFTKYGAFNNLLYCKCVIFPKGKTTWEGFQRPFKDGDILATELGSVFVLNTDRNDDVHYGCYVGVACNNDYLDVNDAFAYKHLCRYATEEEKAKLFQAIKENGYKWNAETKTLEKLIESEFKDGDIIYNQCIIATAIFYKQTNSNTISHCFLNAFKELKIQHNHCKLLHGWRLATEEEKQKLFQAIKEHGYKWNAETKTLETLVEPQFKVGDRIKRKGDTRLTTIKDIRDNCYIITIPDFFGHAYITDKLLFINQNEYELVPSKFDINTLKPFAKVLVRGGVGQKWTHDFFGFMDKDKGCPFVCVGHYVIQCIPFEGNEHLLGKTDDCDEYFKTWE